MAQDEETAVGCSFACNDSLARVTARAKYTDLEFPRMLHAQLVMSPCAHADIIDIDLASASRTKGVIAIVTAKDLPGDPAVDTAVPALVGSRARSLADVVAIVAAETKGIAT